jgi:hypothetical protein
MWRLQRIVALSENKYGVDFATPAGRRQIVCRVVGSDESLGVLPEPDVFALEDVYARPVIAAVLAFHRASEVPAPTGPSQERRLDHGA